MKKDNLIEIKKASRFIDDPITQILRNGAKKLLAKALKLGQLIKGVKFVNGMEQERNAA